MLTETGHPERWIVIAKVTAERSAAELSLVLAARGIEHRRDRVVGGWEIAVVGRQAEHALQELEQYRSENAREIGQRNVEEVQRGGWPGAATYTAILFAVFVCLRSGLFARDWLGAGEFAAGRVLAGEWWRTVTALTTHVELPHLAGNAAFGAFFGGYVGRYLGRGVGWFAILAAGTLANALAALVDAPDHRSIGASTAVFAALGLLTAYTWRRGFLRDTPWRARIAPVVAGLGLLAFTGTSGENTDLGAHLLGFLVGFGTGLFFAVAVRIDRLRSRALQRTGAVAALTVVLAAWLWGLLAAG